MPIGYDSGMLKRLTSADREVLGRGVYGAGESLRLLNFRGSFVQEAFVAVSVVPGLAPSTAFGGPPPPLRG